MTAEPDPRRGFELAAVVRAGLSQALASARPGHGESALDALVRASAITGERARELKTEIESELAKSAAAPRLVPGARVGSLVLEDELGSGSFGRVFRARREALGRVVALKVIPGAGRDDRRRRRFEREVVAQARLEHPGIARIHSVLEVPGGGLACEMELVAGETLEARIAREGALPWRSAATIASRIARALEHAHAQGVVHRDLKPANVLLRAPEDPVIVDLGLALLVDEGSSLTMSGQQLGTPAYMAPEVFDQRAGPPADVYGVGAILHEMLSGAQPFEAENLVALFVLIAAGACKPPVSKGAPRQLEQVRARAMALDPTERPTAGELATALEQVLAGERPRALRRLWRRPLRRAAKALAIVGALALGAAALRVRWTAPSTGAATAPEAIARARSALADGDREKAARATREALALARGEPDLRETCRLAERLQEWSVALEALGRIPRRDDELALAEARVLRATGDRDKALAVLRDRRGRASVLAATLLLELGRASQAAARAKEALAGDDAPLRGAALASLAEMEGPGDALRHAREARAAAPKDASVHAVFAQVALALGAPEDALEAAEVSVALDPESAGGVLARGAARLALGQRDEGRADLQRAATLPPSLHALGALRALAADVAAGEPTGDLARALLREARLAAVATLEQTASAASKKDALRAAETVAALFTRSASAHGSLGLARLMARDPSAAEAARRSLELRPGDAVATLVLAVDAGPTEKGLALIETVARLDDLDARELGAAAPCFTPGRLSVGRALLAISAASVAGHVELASSLARTALEAGLERPWRSLAFDILAEATKQAGRDPAPIEAERARQEPAAVELRAWARTSQVREPDLERLDRLVAAEPWEATHRVLRSTARLKRTDRRRDALEDLAAAALVDDRHASSGLIPILWVNGVAETRNRAAKEVTIDPSSLIDGELRPVGAPLESAAQCVVQAYKNLGDAAAPETARLDRAATALAFLDRARGHRSGARLPRALRAIALDRLGLPLAAEREARAWSGEDALAAAALAVVRAVSARASLGPSVEKLAAACAEEDARAKTLTPGDAGRVHELLEHVSGAPARRWRGASTGRVLLPRELAPLALEEKDGEAFAIAAPDAPLVLDAGEAEVLEVELADPPRASGASLRIEGDGDSWEVAWPKGEHLVVVLDAGRPAGAGPLTIRPSTGRARFASFQVRRRATTEERARDAEGRRRAFELGLGRPPADEKELEPDAALGRLPAEIVWRHGGYPEAWGDATGPELARRVYARILAREPTAVEAAQLEARAARDRRSFLRALALGAEVRAKHGF